ncbi:MAG: hypothetical protein N2C14_21490 [Planctomycetales bacterium]
MFPLFREKQSRKPVTLGFEELEPRLLLSAVPSTNISDVKLWDGETVNPLFNRFGGLASGNTNFSLTPDQDPTNAFRGDTSFRMQTTNTILPGQFGFVQIPLTGFNGSHDDNRDLTPFAEVRFHLRHDSGADFTLKFEIKDAFGNAAKTVIPTTANSQWTEIVIPLNSINLDLSRARIFSLVVNADQNNSVNNVSIQLDEMRLIEKGGSIDPNTAPINDLLERVAARHFRALWGSRDHATGIVPTLSIHPDVGAMNATAGLIQMLPTAVNQGLVTQVQADAYLQTVVTALNTVLTNTGNTGNTGSLGNGGFVPPRYIDLETLMPVKQDPTDPNAANPEESSVDAALLFLALYRYKSLPGTPSGLETSIQNLLNRFDFSAFSLPSGWSQKYDYATGSFDSQTYDGYSGEVWVISLAAHLSTANHVDVNTHYHSAELRTWDSTGDTQLQHVVHDSLDYRPPFVQWLFPLFVDTSNRGVDAYSEDRTEATNPYDNAVLYQRAAHQRLTQLGRQLFAQPDAGDDADTETDYHQYSLYNDFEKPDLFMPWSTAFSFLADPSFAEAALRNHLAHNLHGPLGLSDSVEWATGQAEPSVVSARHDYWNIALAGMAFFQYLHDDNAFFTNLPEVDAALDQVFDSPTTPAEIFVTAVDSGSGSYVRVFDAADNGIRFTLTPYGGFTGGVRVAVGDVNGDGQQDVITGSGSGAGSGVVADVRVFSGVDGSLLRRIAPFDGFRGGVFVASGDVNNDGRDDIIVSADAGAGPHVKVFSGADDSLLYSFYAFGAGFQGGARVASGDVNNDGFDDIIVGSGRGATSDVRVFSGETGMIMHRVVPYNAFTGGVHVASGDLNNNGHDDIITGAGPGAGPHVRAFDGSNPATNLASFLAFDSMFSGGVRVGSADVNNDGFADVITGAGPGGEPQVRTFGGSASFIRASNILPGAQGDFLAFGGFTGGVFVSGAGVSEVMPLTAAAGENTASSAAPLSQADASRLVDAAIDRLAAAGHADSDLDALRDLEVVVADLQGATLGLASGDRILLDADAAGHGWFLDDTPFLDEEYSLAPDGFLVALDSSAAEGIDLLTVALHELGHHLGWEDLDPDLHDLMAGALDLGVRKTP